MRPIIAASLLMLTAPAAAEQVAIVPDPVFSVALRALFDRPDQIDRTILPARQAGDPGGVVRCHRYPKFTVQEVDYGEHGDETIFVTPHEPGKPLPVCGPVPGRREKTVFDSGESYFLGTRGPFGFVVSTSGRDGTPFTIHDLPHNYALYADELGTDTLPSRYTVAGEVLTLDYIRAAKGSCSILNGGATCWKAFAAEAKLPPEIANAPAPLALCAKGYGATAPGEPSVLAYAVHVEIDAAPEINKIARAGALVSCKPQS